MSCQLAKAQTKKGLRFFAHSSRQTQNFTGKEKNQDFKSLLPLLGKKFRDLPSALWLDPSPLYPTFPPTSCPQIQGEGQGLLREQKWLPLPHWLRLPEMLPSRAGFGEGGTHVPMAHA